MEYYGLYMGIVTDTNDPKSMGRVRVNCPAVSEAYVTGWCEPCFPCDQDLYVPAVGTRVWLEFQKGDLSKPVWVGGWYVQGSVNIDSSTRYIRYAGATILMQHGQIHISGDGAKVDLMGGKVYLNDRDVLKEIDEIKDRIKKCPLGGGH